MQQLAGMSEALNELRMVNLQGGQTTRPGLKQEPEAGRWFRLMNITVLSGD